MLFLRFMLLLLGFSLLAGCAAFVLYDIYLALELKRFISLGSAVTSDTISPDQSALPATRQNQRLAIRWQHAGKISLLAVALILLGKSIVVVPDGHAAVRVSQVSGVLPGTLY